MWISLFIGSGIISIASYFLKSYFALKNKVQDPFLQNKLNELKDKMNMKQNIILSESWIAKYVIACACGYGKWVGICVMPGILDMFANEEIEFFIAYGLAHIKNAYNLKMLLFPMIFATCLTILTEFLFPLSTDIFSWKWILLSGGFVSWSSVVGVFVFFFSFCLMSKKYAQEADQQAFQICSSEAQNAIIIFWKQVQQKHQYNRTTFVTKLLFTEHGHFRLDVFHPTVSHRIAYLQKLQLKNV